MANQTTTTSLAALIPEIIAEAMFIANERSLMRNLVKTYNIPFGSGKTVEVPIYGKETAVSVAEGTDLEGGAGDVTISTTSAILTVGEVGLMTLVTDMARNISTQNVIADVGRIFGEAIARKQDEDLLGLFASFTNKQGDGTLVIEPADIFRATAKLRSQGLNIQDMACVISPEVAFDLKSGLTNDFVDPNAGDIQNEAMASGFVGRLAGVPVYESGNIAGAVGVYQGAVFHRDALGLAELTTINIEEQRDASMRGTELVGTAVFGSGQLIDSYGQGLDNLSSIG